MNTTPPTSNEPGLSSTTTPSDTGSTKHGGAGSIEGNTSPSDLDKSSVIFNQFYTYGNCPVCKVKDTEICTMVDSKNSIALDPNDFNRWIHGARIKVSQQIEHLLQWVITKAREIENEATIMATTECPVPNCKAALEKECECIVGSKNKYAETVLRLHQARLELAFKIDEQLSASNKV